MANRLRLELASLNDLAFSTDSRARVDASAHRALAWQVALAQPASQPAAPGGAAPLGRPLPRADEVARLLAAKAGLLDAAAAEALAACDLAAPGGLDRARAAAIAKGGALLETAVAHARRAAPAAMGGVDATGDASDEELHEIEAALRASMVGK